MIVARSRSDNAWGIAALAAALAGAAWMWGFTIDDALISIRYAHHLATGVGYRFDADGPSTDGVTPLPWPFVLAPLARAAALDVLLRAKILGVVAWAAASFAWGRAVARAEAPPWAKGIAVAVLALCLPLAAHAVSGMETALATALATLAAIALDRPWRAAALAGLVAALRPEAIVWAVALTLLNRPKRAAILAVLPLAACGVARQIAFGRAAPLALLAKPSDLTHGAVYVGAALIVSLAPLLAFAPFALLRAPRAAVVITLAAIAHFVAVMLAGGDWMPYARLVAPVLPSLLYAFVLVAARAPAWATAARGVAAIALGAYVMARASPPGRQVGAHVRALVDAARPWLAPARRVATLDIGWPTAATEASIVDLAGLTDPWIAALPGGHTSKRVDAAFLLARDPDVILLYAERGVSPATLAAWRDAAYGRVVDARLARSPLIAERYDARAFLPYGDRGAGYVVLVRRPPPPG